MAAADLAVILPRVLIVSRRTVRKNKFVDFVGNILIYSYSSFVFLCHNFSIYVALRKKLKRTLGLYCLHA